MGTRQLLIRLPGTDLSRAYYCTLSTARGFIWFRIFNIPSLINGAPVENIQSATENALYQPRLLITVP